MNELEQLYQEWRALQPMKEEYQQRLNQKFMLDFNYNSNHLEGNTLTYGQTELLLLFDKTDGNAPMRDYEEMKAHQVALTMVQTAAQEKEQRPLTEVFIRDLHKVMLREDYVEHKMRDGKPFPYTIHAGRYKTRPNSVLTATGERFEYASENETPALMTDLVDWYNEEEQRGEMSPVQLATLFHYRYIRIHPFEDGNGRISRLLVNYILARHGYPMIVVQTKDKTNYLNALNKCDVQVGSLPSVGAQADLEQITPFVEYMEGCLKRALILGIKAAKGESIEEEDDFEKRVALLAREAKMKKENSKYRTESTIKDIVSNVIRPLIADLEISVKTLAPFYSSQEVSLIKLSKSGTATKLDIDDILSDNQNLVGLKRLRIRIVLSAPTDLLTKKAAEVLDVLSLFGPKKYVFQIGNTSYTYEYYTLLDEKDRKQFVKTIQDLLYDAIKKKVEKK